MSAFSFQNPTPEELINCLQTCKHEASIQREVYWRGAEKEIPPVIALANNDDSYYTQVFRNRSQLNAFIDQLRSQADEIWPAEDAFQFWWDNEGSGMAPKPDEETSVHAERIAKIAWANGAYVGCGAKESSKITFELAQQEIARFDNNGFFYKGQWIEDAGEAYRLLLEVLYAQKQEAAS